jgi:hypothetical protein
MWNEPKLKALMRVILRGAPGAKFYHSFSEFNHHPSRTPQSREVYDYWASRLHEELRESDNGNVPRSSAAIYNAIFNNGDKGMAVLFL